MKVKVSQLCLTLWPHGLYSPWNFPGHNTGMSSLSLLQGIIPTQGSNSGIPHCGQILYKLSHKGSPRILEWVAYPFSSRSCPRILEWVAYPFSSRSSQPRNWTGVSCIAGGFFTNWALREDLIVKLKLGNTCICKKHLHLEHRIFSTWPSKKVNRYITKKIHTNGQMHRKKRPWGKCKLKPQ